MDLIDQIGHYFAQQEIQMRAAIDQAVLGNEVDCTPRPLTRKAAHYPTLTKAKPSLSFQGKKESIIKEEKEDLYAQVLDVEVDKHLVQKERKIRPKSARVRRKKSFKNIIESPPAPTLVELAALSKMQAERQAKHLNTVAAIQIRAKQITAEKVQRQNEMRDLQRKEKEGVEHRLRKLKELRHKTFNIGRKQEKDNQHLQQHEIKEGEKSDILLYPCEDENDDNIDDLANKRPQNSLKIPDQLFLKRLALQQRDQLIFNAKRTKDRILKERKEISTQAKLDFDAKIIEKEKQKTYEKKQDNTATLLRLNDLLQKKKQLLKVEENMQTSIQSIKNDRYKAASFKTKERQVILKRFEKEMTIYVSTSLPIWNADEHVLGKEANVARHLARKRTFEKKQKVHLDNNEKKQEKLPYHPLHNLEDEVLFTYSDDSSSDAEDIVPLDNDILLYLSSSEESMT